MPTGSFKDRGASVMLSLLRAQGVDAVLEDSSGNGGAAVAAYAAAGGMAATIMAPASTSPAKTVQMRAHGATLELVPGTRQDTADAAVRRSETSSMPATTGIRSSCTAPRRWPTNCGRTSASARRTTSSPHAAPDRTCWAARSAFPSCYARARSTPCRASSPCSRRTARRSPRRSWPESIRRWPTEIAPTIAEGTAIAQPIRLREVLGALRETRGGAVMLTEQEIAAATFDLARIGRLCRADLGAGRGGVPQAAADRDDHAGADDGAGADRQRLKATPRIAELLGIGL